MAEFDKLELKLSGQSPELGTLRLRLDKKEEKKLTQRRRAILDAFGAKGGDGMAKFEAARVRLHEQVAGGEIRWS